MFSSLLLLLLYASHFLRKWEIIVLQYVLWLLLLLCLSVWVSEWDYIYLVLTACNKITKRMRTGILCVCVCVLDSIF